MKETNPLQAIARLPATAFATHTTVSIPNELWAVIKKSVPPETTPLPGALHVAYAWYSVALGFSSTEAMANALAEKISNDSGLRACCDALKGLLNHYVGLVKSGDAGNWDPEKDEEVIAARAAIKLVEEPR